MTDGFKRMVSSGLVSMTDGFERIGETGKAIASPTQRTEHSGDPQRFEGGNYLSRLPKLAKPIRDPKMSHPTIIRARLPLLHIHESKFGPNHIPAPKVPKKNRASPGNLIFPPFLFCVSRYEVAQVRANTHPFRGGKALRFSVNRRIHSRKILPFFHTVIISITVNNVKSLLRIFNLSGRSL